MQNNFFEGILSMNFHLRLFKRTLLLTNIAGLLVYALLHFILFDFPIELKEELITLLKLAGVCSAFAVAISTVVILADVADYLVRNSAAVSMGPALKMITAAVLIIAVMVSCKGKLLQAGVKKDFNTGLAASYKGMEPERTFLVMNNEIINHTDIPLGESFLLVNDGIKGMEVKNGKVKVGCSLKVSDQQGNTLLNEKDLFEGRDEFDEKDARMLKCTVSTGKPMKWEEQYKVAVTFWDKNGQGKIDNEVTIRSIDLP